MKIREKLMIKFLGVPVVVFLLMVGLASAALVGYLSNTITATISIESPIELVISNTSEGVVSASESYSVSLYGGESYWVETTLTNHVDGLTGYMGENKIVDFDGEGINISYYDPVTSTLLGQVPSCGFGDDWYYYIGDPDWPLPAGDTVSTVTVETASDLMPRIYSGETRIVTVGEMVCTPS